MLSICLKLTLTYRSMDTECSYGEITDDTRGELTIASIKDGAVVTEPYYLIFRTGSVFEDADMILPSCLTQVEESAFEGIAASVVYVPDTCRIIDAYAFRNSSLRQIRIPANSSIADTAFAGCGEVQIYGKAGSITEAFCSSHDNCIFIAE